MAFIAKLANRMKVDALVVKGSLDVICTQDSYSTCEVNGGWKRCGGIGDVLAGVLAALVGWNKSGDLIPTLWIGCAIVREATRRAFVERKREMGPKDVLGEIGGVVDEIDPIFTETTDDRIK